jgi:hypothetical protein
MEIALVIAVLAVAAGVLRGGSLERLAATQFRAIPLLVAGLGVQILFSLWSPSWLNEAVSLGALIGSNMLVLSFLVVNRMLPGVLIAAVGLVLNLAVISSNGAMPVSPEAARTAGAEELVISEGAIKHEVLDDDTELGFLGDVIPIPWPGLVISIGDIVLAAGIAVLAYSQTKRGPRPVDATSG